MRTNWNSDWKSKEAYFLRKQLIAYLMISSTQHEQKVMHCESKTSFFFRRRIWKVTNVRETRQEKLQTGKTKRARIRLVLQKETHKTCIVLAVGAVEKTEDKSERHLKTERIHSSNGKISRLQSFDREFEFREDRGRGGVGRCQSNSFARFSIWHTKHLKSSRRAKYDWCTKKNRGEGGAKLRLVTKNRSVRISKRRQQREEELMEWWADSSGMSRVSGGSTIVVSWKLLRRFNFGWDRVTCTFSGSLWKSL